MLIGNKFHSVKNLECHKKKIDDVNHNYMVYEVT